jgi:hypothetical protein
LGHTGRLVGASKSRYRENKPDNLVVFNANLCTDEGKIWYGDLDVTEDQDKLVFLSKELDKDLYVLFEMHGRFENEKNPLLERAVCIVRQDGTVEVGSELSSFKVVNGKITRQ